MNSLKKLYREEQEAVRLINIALRAGKSDLYEESRDKLEQVRQKIYKTIQSYSLRNSQDIKIKKKNQNEIILKTVDSVF